MSKHYNAETLGISFENKVVLDLGAANGDSSEYFLHMGAKFVIAVDGDKGRFDALIENSKMFNGKMIPIFLYIKDTKEIENLIVTYKPDVVKADIEGDELILYEINDNIWEMVLEYLVETHEGYLYRGEDEKMLIKCQHLNYKIVKNSLETGPHIIYAIKEAK